MDCYRHDHYGILGEGVIGVIKSEVIDEELDKKLRFIYSLVRQFRDDSKGHFIADRSFRFKVIHCLQIKLVLSVTSVIRQRVCCIWRISVICKTAPRALLRTRHQLPMF